MGKTNSEELLPTFIAKERARFAAKMTDSQFFEIFAAQQVLKSNDLSDSEIQNGIVGEGNDGGIDGLYLLINGQVIQEDQVGYDHWKKNIDFEVAIIQAKTSGGFGEDAILKLVHTTGDLFSLSKGLASKAFKLRYNESLLETAGRIRRCYKELVPKGITLKFSYYYVSKGDHVHPNTSNLTDGLKEKVAELFPSAVFSFSFLGAKKLIEIAATRQAETIDLALSNQSLYSGGNNVCLVKLNEFYKFITDDSTKRINRHIFEANVRDYQGDVVVNRQIRDSLQNHGNANFWWLNNGVTIVADRITPNGNIGLLITSPEIVNGLQTANEIYNYFSNMKEEDLGREEREILVRIIVPGNSNVRDAIIKATNSQTKIPPSALKATDPVHWQIEQFLLEKGIFYDRRKNFYKNQGQPQSKIVTITELAQAIIAIKLRRPDDARARPSDLLSNDDTYLKIFSDKVPLELYFSVIRIMEEVAIFFQTIDPLPNFVTNLRYYIAYYAVSLSSGKASPTTDEDIIAAARNIKLSIISQARDKLLPHYLKAGGNDKAAKGKVFKQLIDKDLLKRFPIKRGKLAKPSSYRPSARAAKSQSPKQGKESSLHADALPLRSKKLTPKVSTPKKKVG